MELPPMIAQPFVENAIEHGLRGLSENGKLLIEFSLEANKLILVVTDNGKGLDSANNLVEKKNHRSFAMEITRERLMMLGDDSDNLQIISPVPKTGTGTCVTINVPFKTYAI